MVAPVLHNHDAPADAVSNTDPPAQKVVGPTAVIVAAGNGFTVTTVAADVAEHPLLSVIVTAYEPDVFTVIACVVAPLLHNQDVPDDAVSVTDPPAQKVTGPLAVIVAVGNGLTVTDVAADGAEHPPALVTVTL